MQESRRKTVENCVIKKIKETKKLHTLQLK